ncbi:MAG: hypothetical protein ACKPKO_16230, partial [Candidatus Fonsibacter sp.]
ITLLCVGSFGSFGFRFGLTNYIGFSLWYLCGSVVSALAYSIGFIYVVSAKVSIVVGVDSDSLIL